MTAMRQVEIAKVACDDEAAAQRPDYAAIAAIELRVRVPVVEIEQVARGPRRSSKGRDTTPTARDLCETVKRSLRIRKARIAAFPGIPVAEPAWDILLEVYLAQLEGRRMSVSKLCQVSGAPPTTALRHLGMLVEAGHLIREADLKDRRRIFVIPADHLRALIEDCLKSWSIQQN